MMDDSASKEAASLETVQTPHESDATALPGHVRLETKESNLGSIGPYRLLKKLGEGGMGSVWLAEQVAPVKRLVAVKVIAGYFGERERQRFDLERQSLAIMNHPAIAKVFDAGATEDGQPYLVMEYVPGLRITTYCNEKQLGPRERVELMIKVCEGVRHAHQKAIMHRDLKPSNILVLEVDGKPVPKIIDFGIAKTVRDGRSGDETIFTVVGGAVGTPGYMSPEQADPGVGDIDTRTDVYSLGVVLYELLTASLPFDPTQWNTKPLHEVLRQFHEQDPQSPSTRVSKDSAEAARNTGVEPQKLVRELRGDLDWITLKALEHDRERRYSSPAELASDRNRYLRDEPIIARPPSVVYRARKFVRRNRVAVAFTAVLMLLIAGFAVSMTIERNRARREAETSKRVADFMANIFTVSDPTESRGNSVTARELLDKASAQIETGLGQDPQVKARLMRIMGGTYRGLGLYKQADRLLKDATEIQTRELGQEHAETLELTTLLGVVEGDLGHYAESEKPSASGAGRGTAGARAGQCRDPRDGELSDGHA
jgi:eukaryotic-like serine/threonine-protein kinase